MGEMRSLAGVAGAVLAAVLIWSMVLGTLGLGQVSPLRPIAIAVTAPQPERSTLRLRAAVDDSRADATPALAGATLALETGGPDRVADRSRTATDATVRPAPPGIAARPTWR